jgi:hypothetical protein
MRKTTIPIFVARMTHHRHYLKDVVLLLLLSSNPTKTMIMMMMMNNRMNNVKKKNEVGHGIVDDLVNISNIGENRRPPSPIFPL